jgi:ABC-type multidrug transport system fused ATPase/permease subunit
VPEIVQVSALDCGPAALGAALAGFGVAAPFERLREACHTGRDGTSIDAIEETAAAFGLEAEQVIVPADHLGVAAAGCAPAILVVLEPGGATHFVVLWRLHGRRAQVMDPAAGRRWPAVAALVGAAYRHRAIVPAAAWLAWARSDGLLRPLGAQLAALGMTPEERRRVLREAAAAGDWRALARLDAACRLTRRLVAGGAVRRGRDAAGLLAAMAAMTVMTATAGAGAGDGPPLPDACWTARLAGRGGAGGRAPLPPDGCWSVRPADHGGDDGDGGDGGDGGDEGTGTGNCEEHVQVEGVVLVRLRFGPSPAGEGAWAARPGRRAPPPGALLSALSRLSGFSATRPCPRPRPAPASSRLSGFSSTRPRPRQRPQPAAASAASAADRAPGVSGACQPPSSHRGRLFPPRWPCGAGGERSHVALVLATGVVAAAGRVVETAVLAAALEILPGAAARSQRLGVLAAVAALATAVLAAEAGALAVARAAGRRGELGLRVALAAKLPRLADSYVRGRLIADLAERAHLLDRTRRGAELAAAAVAGGGEAVLAAVAIGCFDRRLAPAAAAVALAAVAVPRLLLPGLAERNRRWRAHAAALGGLYLDVLRGRRAIEAHSAAAALRRRHDERLAVWLGARRAANRARAGLVTAMQALTAAGAAGMVLDHARRHSEGAAGPAGAAGPGLLLVAVWAWQLAAGGQRLAQAVGGELPLHRALMRRVQEVLGAEEEVAEVEAEALDAKGEVALGSDGRLNGAAGHEVAPGTRESATEDAYSRSATVEPLATVEPPAAPVAGAVEATTDRQEPADRDAPGCATPAPAAGEARRRPRRPAGMAICCAGLGVQIDGRWLLRDLSLAIEPGEHVAVLGASGAGKTTLLGTLLGWHRPAAGRVMVDGSPPGPASPRAVRRAMAWVGPEVQLWRGSLLANVTYGLEDEPPPGAAPAAAARTGGDARDADDAGDAGDIAAGEWAAVDALRQAQLLDLVARLPQGLQSLLGEDGGTLSGGEGQRVRWARALVRPGVRLALLDEPCRGLGADQRRELLAGGRARWRAATLLCVTHAPAEALAFDRVVILDQGELAEDGAPAALAARPGSRFRAMLDAEARLAAALARPPWRRLVLERGGLRAVAAERR